MFMSRSMRPPGRAILCLILAVALLCACASPPPDPERLTPEPQTLPPTSAPPAPEQDALQGIQPTHLQRTTDPLTRAQQGLAAYVPVADTQPVVNTLLLSIAAWLDDGGDAADLEPALTTSSDPGETPATVTELDLTGDGLQDVVVRIPVMGLPVLVFVDDGGKPAQFAGYALPPNLEAIQTDFALEGTEIDKPAVELEDMTGDGISEVLFTSMSAGASSYTLQPRAFQWHEDGFRLIFAASLVSWAGTSDYSLEPDPAAQCGLQIVLSYPHLYDHGFDHKMVNHPAGRQVWRWSAKAGRYVLSEQQIDWGQSGWDAGQPVPTSDRLRWLTNEAEEAFRAGQYKDALGWYEKVSHRAEAGNWQPEDGEPDWASYARFRRAETLLLLDQPSAGLSSMEAVAAEMEGDLLGELAQAYLEGYGDGTSVDGAARGVAALQTVDLYSHFFYEGPGALRFPMEARGILYPGAGLAAYLNAHPETAGNPSALQAGLQAIAFDVESVAPLEGGETSITLRLPELPYRGEELFPWTLTYDAGRWRVSLSTSGTEWPTMGSFAP